METLVKPGILILIASSLVFCNSNAMAPQQMEVDAMLALLPTQKTISSPTQTVQHLVVSDLQKEMILLINTFYRDQHFERLSKLKKQKRKNF